MSAIGFALFDTPIGRCGIAWSPRGIAGLQLPEAKVSAPRARLRSRFDQARETDPPPKVRRAITAVVALLEGRARDLSALELDMNGVPPFHRRVYEAARAIPPGATLSYGEVAQRIGSPGAARAVGQALGKNPFAIVVPCHRVLASGGKVGGFSANGGTNTKLAMLAIEGVKLNGASARSRAKPAANGYGFDPDVALAHLRSSDAALARLIDLIGPFRMRLEPTKSVFSALARAIVYQQLSGKAAATIFARLLALFPGPSGLTPERLLATSDETLRSAGLSRSKLLSLRDLAARAEAGEIPTLARIRRMPNEEIIETLTEVRGIGRWTVEMLLMFRLGRPDVLPLDDYGIKKGFAAAFGKRDLPSRAELEKRGQRWAPYRTVASWYLWRVLDAGDAV